MRSLYWALSSMSPMGYGDGPRAITDLEFALSIIVQAAASSSSSPALVLPRPPSSLLLPCPPLISPAPQGAAPLHDMRARACVGR